jgi:hypothetical protein
VPLGGPGPPWSSKTYINQSLPHRMRAFSTERSWRRIVALAVRVSARWPWRILKSHDWPWPWCAVGCPHRGDVAR